MSELTYRQIVSEHDADIPRIKAVYQNPCVARYLDMNDNFFRYVTTAESVYYFTVYESGALIGTVHLEKQGSVLSAAILVFPEYQRLGFGTRIVKDLQSGALGLGYACIEVSVDVRNEASLKLFENAGFIRVSQEDELITLVYQKE